MKHRLTRFIALALIAVPTLNAAAQGERPRPRPVREELRQDLEQQLQRLRMRERWLERQLDAIDRGEAPEPPEQGENRGPDRQWEPSAEDNEKYLAVLRDLQQDEKLAGEASPFAKVLETEGPERDRLLRRLAPRLQRLVDLKDTDPERYEATKREMIAGLQIARAARELSIAVRDADATDEKIAQAQNALRDAIANGFDARAEMTRYEIRDAEERLEQLNGEVSRAEAEREQRITEQLDRMVERIRSGADAGEPGGPDRRPPLRGDRGSKSRSRND